MSVMTDWAALGARVRQARLGRSLSQDQLAARLGVDRSAVARFEGGERKISVLEMMSIADAMQVPLSWLVEEPRPAIVSHRRPLDDTATAFEADSFEVDVALDQAARDLDLLSAGDFLSAVEGLPEGSASDVAAARALAGRLREHLDLGDGPLPAMQDVGARVGLHIMVIPADVDGASLRVQPGLGVAVVGGKRAPGRRRMTAAHEIGHHIIGDEYANDTGVSASRSEREALINAFAQEFLLPAAAIPGAADDPRRQLVRLAADYRVSWTPTVRAARDAGLVSEAEAQALTSQAPVLADFLEVTGADVPPDLTVGETSKVWARAVMKACHAGYVSLDRAAELLRTDVNRLDEQPVDATVQL